MRRARGYGFVQKRRMEETEMYGFVHPVRECASLCPRKFVIITVKHGFFSF